MHTVFTRLMPDFSPARISAFCPLSQESVEQDFAQPDQAAHRETARKLVVSLMGPSADVRYRGCTDGVFAFRVVRRA